MCASGRWQQLPNAAKTYVFMSQTLHQRIKVYMAERIRATINQA